MLLASPAALLLLPQPLALAYGVAAAALLLLGARELLEAGLPLLAAAEVAASLAASLLYFAFLLQPLRGALLPASSALAAASLALVAAHKAGGG